MVSAIPTRLRNALIFTHRWMGVCFCLLFLLWFTSGIAMMYWGFPSVTEADRVSKSQTLDPSEIRLTPEEAYSTLKSNEAPTGVRLNMFDGRPAYRFAFGFAESVVFADNGQLLDGCPPEMSLRIASAWTGQTPSLANSQEQTEEDQWTVSEEFDDLRPLLKYSWPDGEQVYVSGVTCEVSQYTTRASRRGAYLGAVPHWLYFTPLRKRASVWSRLVIWASGLGSAAALLGIVIGVWMYSPSKSYRYRDVPSSVPYAGQKRWHMILGLAFGPLACTWAFSGMLSMDPFPKLQSGHSDVSRFQLAQALRDPLPPLASFAKKPPQQALLEAGPDFRAKELDLISVTGEPVYLARASFNQSLVIPVSGRPRTEFDYQSIVERLRKAARPYEVIQERTVTMYEAYYLDRKNGLPLPAIFIQFNDPERSMYYIDPKTAQIVEGYNSHSRRNRWFYHGLHSLNFPWLYEYRPAWDIVVLALLFGGVALSATALILAYRVLRQKLGHNGPRQFQAKTPTPRSPRASSEKSISPREY
jgi:hypothetical protein